MAGFSAGLAAWKLAFQISPIVLVGGIVPDFIGGYLPIIAITEAINFPFGVLSQGEDIEMDGFFANFRALPGATIISQDIGHYPFANQAIAANATIQQPLQVSMEMVCPAKNQLGYFTKLAIMSALQLALKNHNLQGGTFIVATPSHIYTNCILRTVRDISSGQTGQPQYAWQLDCEQPLITLTEAAGALNSLNSWINGQTQINGPPTFPGAPTTAIGQPATLPNTVVPASSIGGIGTIAPGVIGPGT